MASAISRWLDPVRDSDGAAVVAVVCCTTGGLVAAMIWMEPRNNPGGCTSVNVTVPGEV